MAVVIRWANVVPGEVLTGTVALRAAALHRDGVALVEFQYSLDDVSWSSLDHVNERVVRQSDNGLWHEYFELSVDSSMFADGALYLRLRTEAIGGGTETGDSVLVEVNNGTSRTEYWVGEDGDDGQDGLSEGQAKRTLGFLTSCDDGAIVYLKAGTYDGFSGTRVNARRIDVQGATGTTRGDVVLNHWHGDVTFAKLSGLTLLGLDPSAGYQPVSVHVNGSQEGLVLEDVQFAPGDLAPLRHHSSGSYAHGWDASGVTGIYVQSAAAGFVVRAEGCYARKLGRFARGGNVVLRGNVLDELGVAADECSGLIEGNFARRIDARSSGITAAFWRIDPSATGSSKSIVRENWVGSCYGKGIHYQPASSAVSDVAVMGNVIQTIAPAYTMDLDDSLASLVADHWIVFGNSLSGGAALVRQTSASSKFTNSLFQNNYFAGLTSGANTFTDASTTASHCATHGSSLPAGFTNTVLLTNALYIEYQNPKWTRMNGKEAWDFRPQSWSTMRGSGVYAAELRLYDAVGSLLGSPPDIGPVESASALGGPDLVGGFLVARTAPQCVLIDTAFTVEIDSMTRSFAPNASCTANVTATVRSSDGTVTGTMTQACVAGRATFSFEVDTRGEYSISFESSGLLGTAIDFRAFGTSTNPVNHIELASWPRLPEAGAAGQYRAWAVDSLRNLVTSVNSGTATLGTAASNVPARTATGSAITQPNDGVYNWTWTWGDCGDRLYPLAITADPSVSAESGGGLFMTAPPLNQILQVSAQSITTGATFGSATLSTAGSGVILATGALVAPPPTLATTAGPRALVSSALTGPPPTLLGRAVRVIGVTGSLQGNPPTLGTVSGPPVVILASGLLQGTPPALSTLVNTTSTVTGALTPEAGTLSGLLENVSRASSQKARIHNVLITWTRSGPFRPVSYTTDGLIVVDTTDHIEPSSITVQEERCSFAVEDRKKRGLFYRRSGWEWSVYVAFEQEVTLEEFEKRFMDDPIVIQPEPALGLDRMYLHLVQASYSHPPRHESPSGTHATFSFEASLNPTS